jgi:hypothetical protein
MFTKLEVAVFVPQWQVTFIYVVKVVHEQSGKVEYERLLGTALKFIHLLAIPSSLSRSYSTFPLCSWTTLIEIAVHERF